VANYSGDGNNNSVAGTDEPETVTVTANITVTKTADQATVIAGQTAGFVVTITNSGTGTATGLTLSDPLPPGAGNDVTWQIDTSDNTGNFVPGDFTITGTTPSQNLTLASTFNDHLAAGQTIAVHITGVTTANDSSTNAALGLAGQYAVLYEGTGGHNLQITNVTVNGNVGVGGTGHVQFNGPGTIGGRLDFSAANAGQCSNNNGSNVGPTSVNYSVTNVTTALNTINSLSTSLGGLSGTNISFNNSNQTVNESSGTLQTSGGVSYRVFSITSYSENNGDVVTINGDGSRDPVVFNFAFNSNVNLGGDVTLTGGLTADQVLWNFTTTGKNISLNNNASSYPLPAAFQGDILAPNDAISLTNANLDGRVFGGGSSDMQIVSGDSINVPSGTLPNTATVSATGATPESASATITVTSQSGTNSVMISGTKFNDATGNGFSSDDTPQAGVDIYLYNSNAGLGTGTGYYAMATTGSNGTYSFNNLPAGTYYVQEAVPSGYIQTGGGPNGTAGNTYYTISAQSGHSYTANNFDDYQIPMCAPTNVSYRVTTANGCSSTTVSNLGGNTQQGDTVQVTFTVTMPDQLTLVSYIAPTSSWNQSVAYEQQIFDQATGTFLPGPNNTPRTYSLTVQIPNCYYQIDFVCGPAISELAPPTYNGNSYGPDSNNVLYHAEQRCISSDNGGTQACNMPGVQTNDFATIGFWQNRNGQSLISQVNGGGSSGTATSLGSWLASNFPHLYGAQVDAGNPYEKNLAGATNATVAGFYDTLFGASGLYKTYAQIMATALAAYATDPTLAGGTYAHNQPFGFNTPPNGTGTDAYNVGSSGSALGLPNNSSHIVLSLIAATDQEAASTSTLNANLSGINTIFNNINTTGDVQNATLSTSGIAYTPSQVLSAYGINNLALDGTGQTIAIVDAYDDPAIFQGLDAFDQQFGLTDSGPTLYQQYGPAWSFLTVLNQNGQFTSLPGTDPSGPGTDNWEVETALDVEWAHAVAPGAQIVLVEANSPALSDLMTAVATAASQPRVSVVSMSWGFPEGQAVFAADEANYDSTFSVPGVTFVAGTGDYGAADPEYPAFSPNVLAVGGTSLNLNADNSYNSETGWGYNSASAAEFIGSGGGISMFEPEPAYQAGVQSTGSRTTPDVSLIADPATGAWIADTYNLDPSNPFEVVGGTSLSAPAWAGLVALVNEGRAAAGEATLNSSSPTDTQQALYSLPQSDYNVITSGFNGYTANAGYNLVTGLGTPVANLLVGDLIAYQGPGTTYSGPTVGALQDATLVNTGSSGSGVTDVYSVFSAITVSSTGLGYGQGPGAASTISTPLGGTSAQAAVANHSAVTPLTTFGTAIGLAPGSLSQSGPVQSLGWATNSSPLGPTSQSPATVTITPVSSSLGTHEAAWSTARAVVSSPVNHANPGGSPATDRDVLDALILSRPRTGVVSDAVLDELATDSILWPAQQGNGTITIPVLPPAGVTGAPVPFDSPSQQVRLQPSAGSAARLAALGLAVGLWSGAGILQGRKRRSGGWSLGRKSSQPRPTRN